MKNWVGYILGNNYYNAHYKPFGRIEKHKVMPLLSGSVLFEMSADCAYDTHRNCIGDVI